MPRVNYTEYLKKQKTKSPTACTREVIQRGREAVIGRGRGE
jgi:hypothetical protein